MRPFQDASRLIFLRISWCASPASSPLVGDVPHGSDKTPSSKDVHEDELDGPEGAGRGSGCPTPDTTQSKKIAKMSTDKTQVREHVDLEEIAK